MILIKDTVSNTRYKYFSTYKEYSNTILVAAIKNTYIECRTALMLPNHKKNQIFWSTETFYILTKALFNNDFYTKYEL